MRAGQDDGGGDAESGSEPSRGGPQFIPRPKLWTPGRPGPWPTPTPLVTPEEVRRSVPAGRTGLPSPVKELGALPSAVLIPLYEDESGLSVVLTRRAQTLRTHRGEVSFPGGKAEPAETPIETAIREAEEEVALDRAIVEPLGELDHLTTITRQSYIVPVVALLAEPPSLAPSPSEVDTILRVPLSELMEPGVFREERWGSGETARPVYFFDLFGDTVWGATAALLRQLLAVVTDSDAGGPFDLDPARGIDVVHFELGPDGLGGVV